MSSPPRIAAPRNGPAAMPRNVSAPMIPSARGRAWPSNRCDAAAVPTGTRMPPPMPWMTRPTMSSSSDWPRPATSDPRMKTTSAAEEQAPGAPDVGEAARQRHRDDVGEQVAVDDPRGAAELGEGGLARPIGIGLDEVVDDRRQGDGRDHQLEAREEDAGAEDSQQRVCRAPGHRRRVHGLPLGGRAAAEPRPSRGRPIFPGCIGDGCEWPMPYTLIPGNDRVA